jgi:hypothetical protein
MPVNESCICNVGTFHNLRITALVHTSDWHLINATEGLVTTRGEESVVQ